MKRKSRNTKQKEILRGELINFHSFFTPEDLHQKACKKDSQLGIATVYRFLNDLVGKKEMYQYTCNRKNLYSREKRSHCHFECEKTGKVIHFELDNLDFLKHIRGKIPGTINSVQLEIKGVCEKCQRS